MTLEEFQRAIVVATGPNPLHPLSYEIGFTVGEPPTAVYAWVSEGEYDDGDDLEGAIEALYDMLDEAFGKLDESGIRH